MLYRTPEKKLGIQQLEWEILIDEIVEELKTEEEVEFVKLLMLDYFEISLNNKLDEILDQ